MDLFKDIQKGKFGKNKNLKRAAKHELNELGGKRKAQALENRIKAAREKTKGHYAAWSKPTSSNDPME